MWLCFLSALIHYSFKMAPPDLFIAGLNRRFAPAILPHFFTWCLRLQRVADQPICEVPVGFDADSARKLMCSLLFFLGGLFWCSF